MIYYADFLGVLDRGHALTRWFKRNPDKAGDLTLTPQHEEDFWLWVSSWALFLDKPSNLGYDDTGYDLPDLRVHYHMVPTDHTRAREQVDRNGQRSLTVNTAAGVSAVAKEKRATLDARIAVMREITGGAGTTVPDLQCSVGTVPGRCEHFTESDNLLDQYVIWCDLNEEQRAIEKVFKQTGDAVSSIYGSLSPDEVERRLYQWKDRGTRILLGKPQMLGTGLNLQQCHQVIFVSVGFKFYQFIQALHRNYRFGQQDPVDVHIIYSEAESGVVEILKQKWAQHNQLVERMSMIMKKYGLSHAALQDDLKRKLGVNRVEVKGERFTLIHNDCVQEVKGMADASVEMICTSIPFGNHYEYTEQYEDFGHNQSDEDFFNQMDFLIPELYRVLKPGRVAAIHVKDRILYGHQTKSGFLEVEEFSDDTVKAFRKHGFLYEGRRTVITDVVRENSSTYRLGWSEMCKDASKMGCGLPEYILHFRKAPTTTQQYADEPVTKSKAEYTRARWQLDAHNLWRSTGARPLTPEEYAGLEPSQIYQMNRAEQINTPYNHERHVAICEALEKADRLPAAFMQVPTVVTQSEADWVWDNVQFMGNLNAAQVRTGATSHVCPLPFDLVERLIRLYSNAGDVVLDPFSGLGTVAYCAVKLARYGVGVELNAAYFEASARYVQAMERETLTPTLFDVIEEKEQATGDTVLFAPVS